MDGVGEFVATFKIEAKLESDNFVIPVFVLSKEDIWVLAINPGVELSNVVVFVTKTVLRAGLDILYLVKSVENLS